MVSPDHSRKYAQKRRLVPALALLILLLLSACGSDPQVQQKVDQNKTTLDQAIKHAQGIGVPSAMLAPIIRQEKSLSQTSAPLTLFSSQPVDNYNSNLSQNYKVLSLQIQGLDKQATEQFTYQATLDLKGFEDILGQRQAQQFTEAKTFATQLAQDQTMLAKGQDPKTFLAISANAKDATQALHLLGSTNDKFTSLQGAVKQLKDSNLDTSALDQDVQGDLQLFHTAKTANDFTTIDHQLDAQLQSTLTISTQAIPYVGNAKLNQFGSDIATMKQAGIDTGNYQKQLDADKASLNNAKTLKDFTAFSTQVSNDIASTRVPLLHAQATNLLQQYHQEVKNWGDSHQYTDPNDGQTYRLGYEYDQQGIGSDADAALAAAQSPDDYQGVIDLVNNDMFNLKAMEADSTDKTPSNQAHATDTQLLQHYNVTSGQVIVVSLAEQALRLYQNGQLIHSFLITSGQYDKPSLPGFWSVIDRESPTVFKSDEPKGSAFWYPDTNINVAIGYHSGGYFLHDSWWRADYGPHTPFPHYDSGGDESFAGTGSHGCVNMPENEATWIYNNTSYNTAVLIY